MTCPYVIHTAEGGNYCSLNGPPARVVCVQIVRERDTAVAALTELHRFVQHHLDPDPGPWADYHTGTAAQALARRLEQEAAGGETRDG